MTDEPDAWLPRALAGDREAISALWRSHRPWLAATLYAHKPRSAELDDLLQEVAAIVVEQIVTLRDGSKLRPWLRTVALNVARGAARRELARRGVVRSIEDNESDWIADDRAEAARAANAQIQEKLQETMQRLEALPAEYKEPLLLQCVRGMSQKQIAATLGLPETTIETRLARARRALREAAAGEQSLQNNK